MAIRVSGFPEYGIVQVALYTTVMDTSYPLFKRYKKRLTLILLSTTEDCCKRESSWLI
jgi:hypothetical protein